jgi:hypothetical protein
LSFIGKCGSLFLGKIVLNEKNMSRQKIGYIASANTFEKIESRVSSDLYLWSKVKFFIYISIMGSHHCSTKDTLNEHQIYGIHFFLLISH